MLHHVVNTKALSEKFLELHEAAPTNERTTGEQVTKAQKVKRKQGERNLAGSRGIGSQSKVTRYQSLSAPALPDRIPVALSWCPFIFPSSGRVERKSD